MNEENHTFSHMPNGGKGLNGSHTSFILACISEHLMHTASIFMVVYVVYLYFMLSIDKKYITKVTISLAHLQYLILPLISILISIRLFWFRIHACGTD